MNERIRQLRKALSLTLEEFGQRVGVTKQTVSRIENGVNSVTEQMFKSICREFCVSEEWLRNDTGNMFKEVTRSERVTQIVNALDNGDEFILDVFTTLSKLSPDEWEFLKQIIVKLK